MIIGKWAIFENWERRALQDEAAAQKRVYIEAGLNQTITNMIEAMDVQFKEKRALESKAMELESKVKNLETLSLSISVFKAEARDRDATIDKLEAQIKKLQSRLDRRAKKALEMATYETKNQGETLMSDGLLAGIGTLILMGLIIALCLFGMWGCPKYNVWEQGKAGEAELQRAEANRQIAVLEAKAKQDAAASLAEAEVARARGVAQANKIIGDSLQGNEAYLRYLWIQGLGENRNDVIYVPTEANLPILEAGRFGEKHTTVAK